MRENQNLVKLDASSFEAAIFDDFGLKIKNSSRVEKGYSSQVYKADLGEETIFIRINIDKNIFEAEEIAYKLFEEKGIPVPRIITYQENPPSLGYPTIIMSKAVGKTIKESNLSEEDIDAIYEEIGRLLKKIHEIKLDGFGSLIVKDNELIGKFQSWKQHCEFHSEYNTKSLIYAHENNFITDIEVAKIKEIYQEVNSLNLGRASFLHRDIHQGHLFVEGPHITGIIDLGAIMAGDPRYDIAMALVFAVDPRRQECIKRGYGDLANDPMVCKHMLTIVVRKIFFRTREEIKGKIEPLITVLKQCFEEVK